MSHRVSCMTPHDDGASLPTKEMGKPFRMPVLTPPLLFPSPPLSPYQHSMAVVLHQLEDEVKSYLNPTRRFPVENHQNYSLTINAWSNLLLLYKLNTRLFLNQYTFRSLALETPRRYAKRRLVAQAIGTPTTTDVSDTDASDTGSGMRTRRGTKRSAVVASATPTPDELEMVTPRKKKTKPAPLLALQQQALIDESIPDYSPDAFATLPANNTKCLKIEWKGQPMDLSLDANLDKLHPAEAVLALILRLPVFVYLDSKRRMFFEKVQRMKHGKQFRRTDAQKACRIDVNKALRLFAAFEKVGWLNDELFTKYL